MINLWHLLKQVFKGLKNNNFIKKALCAGVGGAGLLLTACAEVAPFVDSRREAGQVAPVGQSSPERVAVCYNPLWHDTAEVQALAEAACAERGLVAVADGRAVFNCRLMEPNTAFYRCQKSK